MTVKKDVKSITLFKIYELFCVWSKKINVQIFYGSVYYEPWVNLYKVQGCLCKKRYSPTFDWPSSSPFLFHLRVQNLPMHWVHYFGRCTRYSLGLVMYPVL